MTTETKNPKIGNLYTVDRSALFTKWEFGDAVEHLDARELRELQMNLFVAASTLDRHIQRLTPAEDKVTCQYDINETIRVWTSQTEIDAGDLAATALIARIFQGIHDCNIDTETVSEDAGHIRNGAGWGDLDADDDDEDDAADSQSESDGGADA